MNDIEVTKKQLPETLSELSKFVLVGREKLNAVRAEIRAIDKVGLAQEVHEQKLREAQDIADAVLDAEVRIGELLQRSVRHEGGRKKQSSQDDRLSDLGITKNQSSQFQQLASRPEVVEQVKAEARQNGDIVTRESVLREIKKPHVTNNSKDDEWYTPAKYIEAAREVLGNIDLDPASNDFANETVKASVYYTEEMDGLEQEWFGNIWMNPPYSTALLSRFADKLISSNFSQAIVLVNNATETAWFEKMINKATAVVFHKGRIRFVKRDGEHGVPLQGQAFIYYGDNATKFLKVFSEYGWGAKL